MDHRLIAAELDRARLDGRLLAPLSDRQVFDLEDAYEIQESLLERRLRRGEHLIGYKIGYSSQAMREQMGVNEPNFGPLTDVMSAMSGSLLGPGLLQPRVEPEVLVELCADLGPDPSLDEVTDAVGAARCALEVVDSVFVDYRFTIEDNTADGSSAAHVVLGPKLPAALDLAAVKVELFVGDKSVATASGSAALGHPLEALRWLASAAARRGRSLQAGQIVLTGGLTAAFPLEPGGTIRRPIFW